MLLLLELKREAREKQERNSTSTDVVKTRNGGCLIYQNIHSTCRCEPYSFYFCVHVPNYSLNLVPHTVAANKKSPFRFRGTAVQRFAMDKKTVIRLSASLKLRCLRATVCEPTVDVVLGEVLVILKNNNVARAPMAKAVELPFFILGEALCRRASETERELFIGGCCSFFFYKYQAVDMVHDVLCIQLGTHPSSNIHNVSQNFVLYLQLFLLRREEERNKRSTHSNKKERSDSES